MNEEIKTKYGLEILILELLPYFQSNDKKKDMVLVVFVHTGIETAMSVSDLRPSKALDKRITELRRNNP